MTDTTTEAKAILQTERVKQIMAETGMNFAEACNQYIKEKQSNSMLAIDTWPDGSPM